MSAPYFACTPARSHTADDPLNVLIAGLHRKRDDDFVDRLPHQDLFELLDCPNDRFQPATVGVEWFVYEPDHVVTLHGIDPNVSEGSTRQAAGTHNDGSSRVAEICVLQDRRPPRMANPSTSAATQKYGTSHTVTLPLTLVSGMISASPKPPSLPPAAGGPRP
jgi:hypothetical protein